MIDSTIPRAHPCATGAQQKHGPQALWRSKGGFSTKLHLAVEALGHGVRFRLTPGQSHHIKRGPALIEGFACDAMIADRAYDSDALVEQIEAQGAQAVIPSRANQKTARAYDELLVPRASPGGVLH